MSNNVNTYPPLWEDFAAGDGTTWLEQRGALEQGPAIYSNDMVQRTNEALALSNASEGLPLSDPRCVANCARLLKLCTYRLELLQPQDVFSKRYLFTCGEEAFQILHGSAVERMQPPNRTVDLDELEKYLGRLSQGSGTSHEFEMSTVQRGRYSLAEQLLGRIAKMNFRDTDIIALGLRLMSVALGEQVQIAMEDDTLQEFPVLDDTDIQNGEIWRSEMFKYGACTLILTARCFSAQYNHQSVRLFATRVPVTCFGDLDLS